MNKPLSATISSFYIKFILSALCFILLMGCGDSVTPEDQIKHLIKRAEIAAHEKKMSEFRDILSEKYHDTAGRTRKEVIGLLRYYFIQNKEIFVLSRVKSIEFPEPDQAKVTLLTGIAGKPVNKPDDLANLRADLHRIEFTAKKVKDEWKVTQASWSQAVIEDFSFI